MTLQHEWLAILTAGSLAIFVGCSRQDPSESCQPAVEPSTALTLPSQSQSPVTLEKQQVDSNSKIVGFAGIDAETIVAYEKLGGVYCELKLSVGGSPFFSATEENLRTGLPGFRFSKWPKGELPAVSVPFGLGFSGLDVTDAMVEELLELKNISALDLSKSRVTDTGLKDIAGLKQLFALNLSQTPVTDKGVKVLKNVTQLDISDTLVTVAGVIGLTTLTSLNLSDTQVTDRDLITLKKLSCLQSLSLSNTLVTDSGLKEINELKSLTSLSLRNTKVSKAGIKELHELKVIATLDLSGTRLTNAGLKELATFTNLTFLDVSFTGITDAGMKELTKFAGLRVLKVSNTKLTDIGANALKELKNLTELSIENKGRSYETLSQFIFALHQFEEDGQAGKRAADAAYDLFLDAKSGGILAQRAFDDLGFSKREFKSIGYDNVSKIDVLNITIRNLSMIEDATTMIAIAYRLFGKDTHTMIPTISAYEHVQLTDTGLRKLTEITTLTTLNIAGTAVVDSGMKHIAACANLSTLDISYTKVTDAGIKELKQLKSLRSLNISYSSVTDTGILELKGLTNLNLLDLRGTGMTRETETVLRMALPKCKIIK